MVLMMDDRSGEVLDGRYELIRLLHLGRRSYVYDTRHIISNRKVILKMLKKRFLDDAEMLQQFRQEAQAAAAIESKYICGILDMRPAGQDQPFIVMEYLEGETLKERIAREGSLHWEEAGAITSLLLRAVQAFHQVGIVHRNLNPRNVFLLSNSDGIKVLDFGDCVFDQGAGDENDTTPTATPTTKALEQLGGNAIQGRGADLYSVGTTLYEALTGAEPTVRELQNIDACLTQAPYAIRLVIERATTTRPNQAFRSANEMRAALDSILEDDEDPTINQPEGSGLLNVDCAEVPQTVEFDIEPEPETSRDIPDTLVPTRGKKHPLAETESPRERIATLVETGSHPASAPEPEPPKERISTLVETGSHPAQDVEFGAPGERISTFVDTGSRPATSLEPDASRERISTLVDTGSRAADEPETEEEIAADVAEQAAAVCYRYSMFSLQFLLIRTSGGRWLFPKGRREEGEPLWLTAQREALEEAGALGDSTQEPLTTFLHRKGSGRDLTVAAFLLRVRTTRTPSEDNRQPSWFSLEDARNALAEGREEIFAEETWRVLRLARDEIMSNR